MPAKKAELNHSKADAELKSLPWPSSLDKEVSADANADAAVVAVAAFVAAAAQQQHAQSYAKNCTHRSAKRVGRMEE